VVAVSLDLVLCRDSVRSRMYRKFAGYLNGKRSLLYSNHLVRTLGEIDLQPTHFQISSPRPVRRRASFEPDALYSPPTAK
jgi:hypothetical protein